jgi:hypothetical protein
MSHAASQTAHRRLEQSWFAQEYEQCSAILTETLETDGLGHDDLDTLGKVARALRSMTAEAAGASRAASYESFGLQRAEFLRKAAASNNELRIALESDAIAAHVTGPAWATALFEYVLLRASTVGARREQLWETVAFVHWGAGQLLRHCELDEISLARLLVMVLHADMHLDWEQAEPTILKLVMLTDRARLQDDVVAVLQRLAEAGKLSEPEAFLTFDSDGRILDALGARIREVGIRNQTAVALAYFRAHTGAMPVEEFLAQAADVPCMLVSARSCFIVAGDFCPPRLCRSLREIDTLDARPVRLTWWLNVNFPREQLGNAAFIASRVPPFVRSLLASRKATLVLAATGEASWFGPRWVEWMTGIADALSCEAEQLVYMCQNTRFAEDYRAYRASAGLRSRFGAVPLNTHFLIDGLRADPLPAAPTRHFLCFNQRPQIHRAALLLAMERDGLLGSAHLSFNQSITAELPLSGRTLAPWLDMAEPEVDALINAVEPTLPLRLDLSGHGVTTAADAGYVDSFSARLFADAAVYLVTESEMNGSDMCRLTEKTVKGLAAEIPFIVFGNQGTLASLRALGFRTFAPLIDESYDSVEDPVARFKAAYAETRRLAAMPLETLVGLRQVLLPVLQHNRSTLLGIAARLHKQAADGLEAMVA